MNKSSREGVNATSQTPRTLHRVSFLPCSSPKWPSSLGPGCVSSARKKFPPATVPPSELTCRFLWSRMLRDLNFFLPMSCFRGALVWRWVGGGEENRAGGWKVRTGTPAYPVLLLPLPGDNGENEASWVTPTSHTLNQPKTHQMFTEHLRPVPYKEKADQGGKIERGTGA